MRLPSKLQGSHSSSRPSDTEIVASQSQAWLEARAMPCLSKTKHTKCMDISKAPILHHSHQLSVIHPASRTSLGKSSPQYRYTSLPHSGCPFAGTHRVTSSFQHNLQPQILTNAELSIQTRHYAPCAMDSRNRDFPNMYDFLGVHITHDILIP